MKYLAVWIGALLLSAAEISLSHAAENTAPMFNVLQFNVWHEGTQVSNGLEKICDVIVASKVDVVCFSEVRNYKQEDWTTKVVEMLKKKGQTFYGKYAGGDVGLVSKFPITESIPVFDQSKGDSGSIIAWRLAVDEKRSAIVASAHLDYKEYGMNLIRGYNGGTPDWKIRDANADGVPDPITNVEEILAYNNKSSRIPAIKAFIEKAKTWDVPVILCGDFNEDSHLDWTAATKDAFDHHGVVIEWPCTKLLADAGFLDAWREVHPDPLKQPGATWPAVAAGKGPTSWTPKADERDRIDFVFGKGLKAHAAWLVGPVELYVRNQPAAAVDKELVHHADLPWPSDHKAVLAEYEWIDLKK